MIAQALFNKNGCEKATSGRKKANLRWIVKRCIIIRSQSNSFRVSHWRENSKMPIFFFCTLNLQTSSIWVASSIHTKYTAIVTKLDKITSSDRYESAFVFDGKCKLFCHLSYNNFLLSSFVYNDSFNAYAFASIMRRHSHFVRRKFVIYLLRHTHTNTNICADFT